MLDSWSGTKQYKGKEVQLTIFDTAGHDDLGRIRPIAYNGADCFIVCYAVNDRDSFKNASTKWLQEIKNCAQVAPCILVGTKSDLRKEAEDAAGEELKQDRSSQRDNDLSRFVTTEELMESAKKFNFQGAIECSSKNFQDSQLNRVFLTAFRAVFQYRELMKDQKSLNHSNKSANRAASLVNEQGLNISAHMDP